MEAESQSIHNLQLQRLDHQFQSLEHLLQGFNAVAMDSPTANGKWSAKQQLAHLARYHEIFQERLTRILQEDRPRFDRYRAEDDPDWPIWEALQPEAVIARWRNLRLELTRRLEKLPADSFKRSGVHPALGQMTLEDWLEFFLVHEGHHMYAIFMLAHALKKES